MEDAMNPLAVWRQAKAHMPIKLSGYVIDGIAPSTSFIDGKLTITFSRPQYGRRFLDGQWEGKPVPDVVAQYVSDEAGIPVTVAVNPFCLNGVRISGDLPDSKPGGPTHPRPQNKENETDQSTTQSADHNKSSDESHKSSGISGFFKNLFHRD
jgi:hypothetical protein